MFNQSITGLMQSLIKTCHSRQLTDWRNCTWICHYKFAGPEKPFFICTEFELSRFFHEYKKKYVAQCDCSKGTKGCTVIRCPTLGGTTAFLLLFFYLIKKKILKVNTPIEFKVFSYFTYLPIWIQSWVSLLCFKCLLYWHFLQRD